MEKQRVGWSSNLSWRYNALCTCPRLWQRGYQRGSSGHRDENHGCSLQFLFWSRAFFPSARLQLAPATCYAAWWFCFEPGTHACHYTLARHWFILLLRVSTVSRRNCTPLHVLLMFSCFKNSWSRSDSLRSDSFKNWIFVSLRVFLIY